MARATLFTVSDTDSPNFPTNQNDLDRRLLEITYWIPKRPCNNNMEFVKKAFTLLKDCGLITKTLAENLNDEEWCRNVFKCQMNPMPGGGVLRKEGLPMCSSNNLRYYCPIDELAFDSDIEVAGRRPSKSKLAVMCNGETYYISNNWFHDENRRQKEIFYNWLEEKTRQACKARWE